jgi:hypothetical protein
MHQIYLSRRNLLTLLSKLDRQLEGQMTACSIIKHDGQDEKFNQTLPIVCVTAVEDKVYYGDRQPGLVHPLDTPSDV